MKVKLLKIELKVLTYKMKVKVVTKIKVKVVIKLDSKYYSLLKINDKCEMVTTYSPSDIFISQKS